MPWEIFRAKDGTYLVNWEGITRIIRSYARAKAMEPDLKDLHIESNMFGPDLYSVEVDWDRVRNETALPTANELKRFHASAQRSMQNEIEGLVDMIETADDVHEKMRLQMQAAQDQTTKNVEESVHKGEIGIKVAAFIRDASAETLMVGATYLTAGGAAFLQAPAWAAPAFITGGSLMKGTFAYQDTRRVGDAVATFSTNLLLGAADLKVGAIAKGVASKVDQLGIAFVWAKAKALLEVPKSLIEGKNLNEAVSAGLVKTAAATPETAGVEQLKAFLETSDCSGWAIPVEVTLNMIQDKVGEVLAKAGEKTAESKAPPAHHPPVHYPHQVMDAVLYDRAIIEKSAVRKARMSPRG